MSEKIISNEVVQKLTTYHRSAQQGIKILEYYSPVANNAFPGDFNVSGYHEEVNALPDNVGSFWGIDRCIRTQERIDDIHSHVFHMGVFATSLDLKSQYSDPFSDKRFATLQARVLTQCLDALKSIGFNVSQLEATFLDNYTFGRQGSKGRDKKLKKQYTFSKDTQSENILKKHQINTFAVSSLANIDINPVEGALVGPRVELAIKGIEIATIVFNCFRIKNDKLEPINYIAGYALGIERLETTLAEKSRLVDAVERYKVGYKILQNINPALKSSLFHKETLELLFSIEALSIIKDSYNNSKSRKELVRLLKQKIQHSCDEVGIDKNQVTVLYKHYEKALFTSVHRGDYISYTS